MPRELVEIAIDRLSLRQQVRESSGFDDESLAGLARSICESGGVHQPLLVRREDGELVILDGERRYRAAKLAGLLNVPIIIEDVELTSSEITHRQFVLDAQRVGLSIVERGRAVACLISDAGWTAEQAAGKLGISPASVSRMLAVLKLPGSILQHVQSGRISPDAAYQLSRVDDADEQARLAEDVTEGLLTRDALSRKLKRVQRAQSTKRSSRVTATLGSGRTVTFAGNDLSLESVTEWLEQLLSRAKKAKTQGLSLHTFVRTLKDQATS